MSSSSERFGGADGVFFVNYFKEVCRVQNSVKPFLSAEFENSVKTFLRRRFRRSVCVIILPSFMYFALGKVFFFWVFAEFWSKGTRQR